MPESISSSTSAAAASATSSTQNALGQLDSNAFLKLLTAQLKYQNPFSPADPSAMLGQVATYAQVEALQKIQAAQAASSSLEQARMAGEIMGKRVTGTDANGTALTGIVSSARFTSTGPVLTLDSGKEMPLNRLETIAPGTAAVAAPPTATSGSTASGSTTSGPTTPGTSTSGTSTSDGAANGGTTSSGSSASAGGGGASTSTTTRAGNPSSGTPSPTDPAAITRSVVAAVSSYTAAVAAATRRAPALVA